MVDVVRCVIIKCRCSRVDFLAFCDLIFEIVSNLYGLCYVCFANSYKQLRFACYPPVYVERNVCMKKEMEITHGNGLK